MRTRSPRFGWPARLAPHSSVRFWRRGVGARRTFTHRSHERPVQAASKGRRAQPRVPHLSRSRSHHLRHGPRGAPRHPGSERCRHRARHRGLRVPGRSRRDRGRPCSRGHDRRPCQRASPRCASGQRGERLHTPRRSGRTRLAGPLHTTHRADLPTRTHRGSTHIRRARTHAREDRGPHPRPMPSGRDRPGGIGPVAWCPGCGRCRHRQQPPRPPWRTRSTASSRPVGPPAIRPHGPVLAWGAQRAAMPWPR
ncbi:hypothetical protein ABIA38_002901 [Embleya sp. AB8]